MRCARLIGGAVWMLAMSLTAHAGSAPFQATVIVPEVEVRCLPSASANSYATSKLRQGAIVEVLEEKEGGWLAIKPPPGSFSWVQTRFLQRPYLNAPSGVILGEGVEVRLGSSVVDRRPDVFQVRLPRGAQVVILNGPRAYDDETGGWVMIQPPEREVRFIPADAVKAASPVQTVSSAAPTGGSFKSAPSGVPSVGTQPLQAGMEGVHSTDHVPVEDPLWLQAKQAEKEGKFAEAEQLYLQLARQTPDHNLCIRCYNHIHYMKARIQVVAPGTTATTAPVASPVSTSETRLVPTAAIPYPQVVKPAPPAMAQATSQYTYIREPATSSGRTAPATAPAATPVANPPAPAGPQTVGPGLLVRAVSPVAGQQAYMFDRGEGQPIFYVLASPGVNLESYINSRVSITGPIAYHQGYRREVLTAVQVIPQR